jgi:endonuclease YncB( thermonuclease family)
MIFKGTLNPSSTGLSEVDGDTVDLDLDLGFSITLRQRVRLYGIDAPEVRTSKEEKYGRMLADCYREGEPSLYTELLERGLARPYLS